MLTSSPIPNTHGLAVLQHQAPIQLGTAKIVEHMNPDAMTETPSWAAELIFVQASHIFDMVIKRAVDFCARLHKLVIQRKRSFPHIDDKIVLRMNEP